MDSWPHSNTRNLPQGFFLCFSQTKQSHHFYSDDTQLTHSAIRQGLGISILPCFMGDPDPELVRYCEPDPTYNLGLWVLLHPDLKRTARVLAFRDHMEFAIKEKRNLFQGLCVNDDV